MANNYEELVKRLRILGTWRENGEVMEQAADAIEELSNAQEQWIEQERNDRYGVSKKTMQNAIKGVTWKCVPYYPEPPKEE